MVDDIIIRKSSMAFLFGTDLESNKNRIDIKLAADKAYGDMARHTLNLKEKGKRNVLKDAAMEMIFDSIQIKEKTRLTSSEYDKWHKDTCDELKRIYANQVVNSTGTLTYGQAQKWLNMTVKYLFYIYSLYQFDEIDGDFFKHAHVPLDSIMYSIIETELHIDKPKTSWSKTDDYGEYLKYQNYIRRAILDFEYFDQPISPLEWEMLNWK